MLSSGFSYPESLDSIGFRKIAYEGENKTISDVLTRQVTENDPFKTFEGRIFFQISLAIFRTLICHLRDKIPSE